MLKQILSLQQHNRVFRWIGMQMRSQQQQQSTHYYDDRRVLKDSLDQIDDQKYIDALYKYELIQEIRDEMKYQNRDDEYNMRLEQQRQSILGQNYGVYKDNRYKIEVEGLNGVNDYMMQYQNGSDRLQNHKMDYEVDYLSNRKEGVITTQRNQVLQKTKEYDYLDHQNINVKNRFKYVYQNVNDHYSRFIQECKYEIGIDKNVLIVGSIPSDISIQNVYQSVQDQNIIDIQIVYDVMGVPCYMKIVTNDIETTRHKIESRYRECMIMDQQSLQTEQKSVVIQNIDVTRDIRQSIEEWSRYGRIVRIEMSQVVSNQNQPSREQLMGYLNNIEFNDHKVLQLRENEKVTGVSTTYDWKQKEQKVEFNNDIVDSIDHYEQRWDERQQKINQQYINMFMERNVFEYEERDRGLEGFTDSERDRIQQSIRKQKSMNNLGYVIIEYSQKREAQGCLLDLGLNGYGLISDLQKTKNHLHSDPFYFYQKMKRLNYEINQQKQKQKEKNDYKMDRMDFEYTSVLVMDEVYKKQPYTNPMNYDKMSNEAIQLYLGEKEFNDQNEIDMRLDEYLKDQQSLGRQKLMVDQSDVQLFRDSIRRHIEEIEPGMLESVDKRVQETEREDQKQNSKQIYDQLLKKVIDGEYSRSFMIEVFEEQMDQKQVKRSMIDYVEHIELNNEQYIRNSEIEQIMKSNYNNHLLNRLTSLDCKQYQKMKTIFERHMELQTDQERLESQGQTVEEKQIILNYLMKEGIVDGVMEISDEMGSEQIQDMLKLMNDNEIDSSTSYQSKQIKGQSYLVRMVQDRQKVDIGKILEIDSESMLKSMGIDHNLVNHMDIDGLLAGIDIDQYTDQQLQSIQDELGIGIIEIKALLNDQVDEQTITKHIHDKDMESKWKQLQDHDLIKSIGRSEGMRNNEGLFNQSRYRII